MMSPHLFPLLLSLLAASSGVTRGQSGFWNIDCGSSQRFVNASTNLTWVGDAGFVRAGEAVAVPNSNHLRRELRTLRVFRSPRAKKNCYTVPAGPGARVLVRARFYYGDYDGLAAPPEFSLTFDSDYWSTVYVTPNLTTTYELVYVTRSDTTSICVVRTGSGREQHPFISSLEVKTLGRDTYRLADPRLPMYSMITTAYGVSTAVRYPHDRYDRIWGVGEAEGLTEVVTNTAGRVNTSVGDAPPEEILRAAVTPADSAANLTVRTANLHTPGPVFYNMYFTEVVANLSASGDRRAFDVYMDGVLLTNATGPVAPRYGAVTELTGRAGSASGSTRIELVRAADSTLPPVLSAMEVFRIIDPMTDGTNSSDVEALSALQGKFGVLQEWTGDPCLPSGSSWEWVGCETFDSGSTRVTKLQLGGYNLSGSLPDFSGLDAVQIINLNDNRLAGDVPEFLGNFRSLRRLNLADNDFSSIPPPLTQNKMIVVNFTGNRKLCEPGKFCGNDPGSAAAAEPLPAESRSPPPPPPRPSGGNRAAVPVLSTVDFLLLAVICACGGLILI